MSFRATAVCTAYGPYRPLDDRGDWETNLEAPANGSRRTATRSRADRQLGASPRRTSRLTILSYIMASVERRSREHNLEGTDLTSLLEGRPRRNYAKRTHEELLADVNGLYDKLLSLVRERDELRAALGKTQRQLDALNLKFWIVSSLVVAEGGAIVWFANQLFSRLK